jgi:hypothetical protein
MLLNLQSIFFKIQENVKDIVRKEDKEWGRRRDSK